MRVQQARPSRRTMLVGLPIIWSAPASAQSVTGDALEDFARYADAAAALFAEFALGLRSAEASTLSSPETRAAVEDVSRALQRQAVANGMVVDQIGSFLRRAYAAQAPENNINITGEARASREAQLDAYWNGAMQDVRHTSNTVQRVIATVEATPELDRVLTPERRLALSDTLAGREVLLDRLAQLPRPRTVEELERLTQFNARYQRLISALQSIRLELRRLLQR